MTASHNGVTDAPPAAATWRLLGVVGAQHPPVDGVRYLQHGRVAAAVVDHDEARPVRTLLREHAEKVEQLFALGPVLPARYGTLLEHPAVAVTALLEPNHEGLAETLREVDGRAEVLVRVEQMESAAVEEAVRRDPQLHRTAAAMQSRGSAARHEERLQVGQRVARAVELLAEEDVDLVTARLAEHAVSVRGHAPGGSKLLLEASYLVPSDRFDEFDAVVGELTELLAPRVQISAVGPMAPYSFADLQGG